MNKQTSISETTILKVLVNIKCLGYMGRCARRFSSKDRAKILDILEKRGLIDEHMNPTLNAMPIITENLHLCEE